MIDRQETHTIVLHKNALHKKHMQGIKIYGVKEGN